MLVSLLASTSAAEASNKGALIKLLQGYQQENFLKNHAQKRVRYTARAKPHRMHIT